MNGVDPGGHYASATEDMASYQKDSSSSGTGDVKHSQNSGASIVGSSTTGQVKYAQNAIVDAVGPVLYDSIEWSALANPDNLPPPGGWGRQQIEAGVGLRSPVPRWSQNEWYRGEGRKSSLEHIKSVHWYDPGRVGYPKTKGEPVESMFAKGTTRYDLEVYARIGYRNPKPTKEGAVWRYEFKVEGRLVGYDNQGKRTDTIVMYVTESGNIRTMYPY